MEVYEDDDIDLIEVDTWSDDRSAWSWLDYLIGIPLTIIALLVLLALGVSLMFGVLWCVGWLIFCSSFAVPTVMVLVILFSVALAIGTG